MGSPLSAERIYRPQHFGDSTGELIVVCVCIVWFVSCGRSLKSGQVAFETLLLCRSEVDQRHFGRSLGWFTNWTISILLRMSFLFHWFVWITLLVSFLAVFLLAGSVYIPEAKPETTLPFFCLEFSASALFLYTVALVGVCCSLTTRANLCLARVAGIQSRRTA